MGKSLYPWGFVSLVINGNNIVVFRITKIIKWHHIKVSSTEVSQEHCKIELKDGRSGITRNIWNFAFDVPQIYPL